MEALGQLGSSVKDLMDKVSVKSASEVLVEEVAARPADSPR